MNNTLKLSSIKFIDEEGKIYLNKDVACIQDLIELSDMYIEGFRYNINLLKLKNIKPSLVKLNNMIGLERIKKDIVKQILYFLQNFQEKNEDMLHTVIQGPPGVGKTMIGEIIGEIYFKLKIIQSNDDNFFDDHECKFRIVKRTDLIGQYLGWTAKKTQEVIDSCIGGVMFIDEAYALGNEDKKDIYAKECIDTINQNLTEKKNQFLCIIAGYEEDLNKCFFAYNEGLRRRFPFVYTIDKYSSEDLKRIFYNMMNKDNWNLDVDPSELRKIFAINSVIFTNMAGDMETLVFNCKLEHSSRVFCLDKKFRKIIIECDLLKAIEVFRMRKEKTINNEIGNDKDKMLSMYT
jgi:SpoVK/Ycf46/Vps4 family AAA+-type ATPase